MDDTFSTNINDYTVVAPLGHGSYGSVVLVTYNGKSYAMKKFGRGVKNYFGYSSGIFNVNGIMRQEIDILLRLRHPNIIKGYQMVPEMKSMVDEFNWLGRVSVVPSLNVIVPNIVMELGQYTLNSVPDDHNNDRKIRYMFEFLSAMKFLHGLGYLHCDLKTDNILIVNGALKLADLGLLLNRYTLPIFMSYKIFCNSMATRAPEFLQKEEKIYMAINKADPEQRNEIISWISNYSTVIKITKRNEVFVPILNYIKGEFFSMGLILLDICRGRPTSDDVWEIFRIIFKISLLPYEDRVQAIQELPDWPPDFKGPSELIAHLIDGDPQLV